MEIAYTRHAQERMKKRRVSKSHVEAVLADPDFENGRKGAGKSVLKKIGKREIEVIYKKQGRKYVVITLWVYE